MMLQSTEHPAVPVPEDNYIRGNLTCALVVVPQRNVANVAHQESLLSCVVRYDARGWLSLQNPALAFLNSIFGWTERAVTPILQTVVSVRDEMAMRQFQAPIVYGFSSTPKKEVTEPEKSPVSDAS